MTKERGSMESIVVDGSGKRLEAQGIGDNAMGVKSGLKQVDNNYGGQAEGKTASTRQKQKAATEIQWTTVGKADKSSAAREKKTAVPTKQSARKLSPQRKRQSDYSADKQRKNNGRNWRGADQGDGEVVFKQLRSYLLNDAPAEYVFHLVQRLNELARTRRFQKYEDEKAVSSKSQGQAAESEVEWQDDITSQQRAKYKGIISFWENGNEEHAGRMQLLLKQWVVKEGLDQEEIEERIHCFTFTSNKHEAKRQQQTPSTGGYLRAVTQQGGRATEADITEEQQRLLKLCMKPVAEITKLRERTEDEDRALLMILNQELEVPFPPRFLVQSMTPMELATFTDMFIALEYPLYAQLAPGQRFGGNLSRGALLAQITVGAEAPPKQQQEIDEFKAALSRIELDSDTRVITVTFKGKNAAKRWIGWRLPLAMRLLQLVDYESQRVEARTTFELVKLDYYNFTVSLRKGAMTSKDLLWVLGKKMGLQVQTLAHTEIGDTGINDKQWIVKIRAKACPPKLKDTGYIIHEEAEMVVHHQDVHVNWPCKACRSPEHPTKYCKVEEATMENTVRLHTFRVIGAQPFKTGKSSRMYQPRALPTTMEQLRRMLKGLDGKVEQDLTNMKEQQVPTRGQRKEAQHQPTSVLAEGPTLPREWEQLHSIKNEEAAAHNTQNDNKNKVHSDAKQIAEEDDGNTGNKYLKYKNAQVGPEADSPSTDEQHIGDIEMVEEVHEADGGTYEETTKNRTAVSTRSISPRGRTTERRILTANRLGSNVKKVGTSDEPPREEGNNIEERDNSSEPSPGGKNKTATVPVKLRSTSPKRHPPAEWELATGTVEIQTMQKLMKTCTTEEKARSRSPTRTSTRQSRKEGRRAMQQFMHHYYKAPSGDKLDGVSGNIIEKEVAMDSASMSDANADHEMTQVDTAEDNEDLESCVYMGSLPPTDHGFPIETWMGVLGGTITDVEANGHCGWYASYAALSNVSTGLVPPSSTIVKQVNELKKQVINGMIANLVDEAQLRPEELAVELEASGNEDVLDSSLEIQIRAIAAHYVDQRKKSVRTEVSKEFWVRPTHLQAMAMHARETVYVLDMDPQGMARLQAYAYKNETMPNGGPIETGTTEALDSGKAIEMLQDMVGEGILPTVMVLRWNKSGNHFQAVTYDAERYQCYSDNMEEMLAKKNMILAKHGRAELDRVPYDQHKTAKAATKELKAISRATSATKKEEDVTTTDEGDVQTHEAQLNSKSPRHIAKAEDRLDNTITLDEDSACINDVQSSKKVRPGVSSQENLPGQVEHQNITDQHQEQVSVSDNSHNASGYSDEEGKLPDNADVRVRLPPSDDRARQ